MSQSNTTERNISRGNYNRPCKYYKSGCCMYGSKCKYLHGRVLEQKEHLINKPAEPDFKHILDIPETFLKFMFPQPEDKDILCEKYYRGESCLDFHRQCPYKHFTEDDIVPVQCCTVEVYYNEIRSHVYDYKVYTRDCIGFYSCINLETLFHNSRSTSYLVRNIKEIIEKSKETFHQYKQMIEKIMYLNSFDQIVLGMNRDIANIIKIGFLTLLPTIPVLRENRTYAVY